MVILPPRKSIRENEKGAVQLCWYHDKMRMDGEIPNEKLEALADENWENLSPNKSA